MRRRAVHSELPYTNQPNCDFSDANGKNKNTGSRKLLPTLLVAICVVVPCVYGLSRLRSGGSGSEDAVAEEEGSQIWSRKLESKRDSARVVKNKGNPSALTKFGEDTDEGCAEWATNSECQNNRVLMLSKCPYSCHSIAGVSVDSLSEHDVMEDAMSGFAHFLHDGDEDEECMDHDVNCESMAEEGKCMEDFDSMQETCPKSCHICFGTKAKTVTIDFGVEQQVGHPDPEVNTEIMNVIKRTQHYMVDEVFAEEEYEEVRRDCRNLDPECSAYAAMGECHGDVDAMGMQQNCAPACHACNGLEYWRRCLPRPEDVDAMQPGDISAMFERIIRDYTSHNPTVLSKPGMVMEEEEVSLPSGEEESISEESLSSDDEEEDGPLPWIVTLDNFLTDAECDWLIDYGYKEGFEQTGAVSNEIREDGTYGDSVGEHRTSTDVWCAEGCVDQPVGRSVMDRMLELTKIDEDNTEPLEILKYETGGHHDLHHDVIPTTTRQRCGARIITVYVFLSDVEEGGELRFNEMDKLKVKPRKGKAVIWHNVWDSDLGKILNTAYHEGMPVKQGKKYGCHQWFHLRNMTAAQEDDCCDD